MQTFDWIVVGNGLAGAALSYELAKQRLSVLLVDQSLTPDSATRYSYGGIPYWSGTSDLTRQLFAEGLEKQRHLSDELGHDTEFRELNLVLTLPAGADGASIAATYQRFDRPPRFVSADEACQIEPLLNPDALAGALVADHAQVSPQAIVKAYNQAFQRLGGLMMIATVTGLVRVHSRVTGITTAEQAYAAQQVVVAAGGYSRALLRQGHIHLPVYHTHAELIETPPVDLTLQTIVMPAKAERFALEAAASQPEKEPLWDEPNQEITAPILDSGVAQLRNGQLRIGQISRTLTQLDAPIDAEASEDKLRSAIAPTLPALPHLPGTWHRCLVTFSRDGLPLVGSLPGLEGLQIFVGFSAPFGLLPPIAARFATAAVGAADPLLQAMAPSRFEETQRR